MHGSYHLTCTVVQKQKAYEVRREAWLAWLALDRSAWAVGVRRGGVQLVANLPTGRKEKDKEKDKGKGCLASASCFSKLL